MRRITRVPFGAQILAGLGLGVLLGYIARAGEIAWLATRSPRSADLRSLLNLAVPPLVFTAVVVSVANLRNVGGAARLAGKTLGWFLVTSLLAVAVGLAPRAC